MRVEFLSRSADETRAIGRQLAPALRVGDVLFLHGDLGAGKTTFAQGIAAGLGIVGPVQSPTFTLVNEYDGPVRLYHLDLYRLSGADDIAGLGYEEYLEPSDGITVVEWPERAGSMLPETYLLVTLVAGAGIRHRLIFDPVGDDEAASRWNRALTSDCKG